MGHYLSEMTSDDEWKREIKMRKATRAKLVKKIQSEVDKRGVAEFLADIIEQDSLTRLCRELT